MLLTIVGLYVSLSYDLSQCSLERLRAALGADRLTLLRLALWQGVWPALLGLAAGLVTATSMIPLTRAYLFDGSSMGVLPLAAAALVVVPVAIAASLVPAMRVAAVNPAQLLKGSGKAARHRTDEDVTHSERRASIGSTFVARRAGRYDARVATRRSVSETAVNVAVSSGVTPNSRP